MKTHAGFILIITLCASSCAPFPKRVRTDLVKIPQLRDAKVDSKPPYMIAWKAPEASQTSPTAEESIHLCGGQLGKLFSEWRDIPSGKAGNQMRFVHGRAAASEFSANDFWGTHRYRDWSMLLVVDQDFQTSLAPANYLSGGWDDDPIVQDLRIDNPDIVSLVEFEWDSGFFAPEMAPEAGDETLALGRWVFDCGHEGIQKSSPFASTGFRAELHAPEILVSAHVLESSASEIHVRFKVFAGSRSGPVDTIPIVFFLQRFFSSHQNPLGGKDYSVSLQPPEDGWKLSSCTISDGVAAGGSPRRIRGTVQVDDGGRSLTWRLSASPFVSSARLESSELVDVRWTRNESASEGIRQCQ